MTVRSVRATNVVGEMVVEGRVRRPRQHRLADRRGISGNRVADLTEDADRLGTVD